MKIKILLTGLLLQTSLFLFSQATVVDSIISGGIYRSYRLYIPAAYNGTADWPLVFDLHGYTSNASAQQYYSNFMPIADTAHFLVVYPQGTTIGGQPYWNAGQGGGGVNDVQFISELIDTLKSQYSIDAESIYSCGMSNGGYLSHSLACTLNDKITAVASVTGSMFASQYAACKPGRAVPVMQVSGTADGTVPYTGALGTIHIDTLVKYWVENNSCNPAAQFSNVPNTSLTDGCTAEHYVYSGGTNGASCELYKIIGGGHTWPGSPFIVGVTNQDFNASLKIWLFFRKYRLSQLVGIEETQSNREITIYPNPGTYEITINGMEKYTEVFIQDVSGKTIIETTTKEKIDISGLSKGIYSVTLISDGHRVVKKLVKL